jgi:hypothetical protein
LQHVPKGQTRAELSSTSTTASTLNPKNDRTTELISHRPLESSIKTLQKNNESNCTESELSNPETRNGLLGVDIATDQTKTFNTEVSPRKVFRSNHRRRIAPSDPSLIKPSCQKQVARPEKPKRRKTFIDPNISLDLETRG